MSQNRGGRPQIDPGGAKRDSIRIAGAGYTGMPLSMLPAQAAFLERVGGGNRSLGFRRVIALLAHAAEIDDLLWVALTAVQNYESHREPQERVDKLERWLKELDGILEHGRAQEGTEGTETAERA